MGTSLLHTQIPCGNNLIVIMIVVPNTLCKIINMPLIFSLMGTNHHTERLKITIIFHGFPEVIWDTVAEITMQELVPKRILLGIVEENGVCKVTPGICDAYILIINEIDRILTVPAKISAVQIHVRQCVFSPAQETVFLQKSQDLFFMGDFYCVECSISQQSEKLPSDPDFWRSQGNGYGMQHFHCPGRLPGFVCRERQRFSFFPLLKNAAAAFPHRKDLLDPVEIWGCLCQRLFGAATSCVIVLSGKWEYSRKMNNVRCNRIAAWLLLRVNVFFMLSGKRNL